MGRPKQKPNILPATIPEIELTKRDAREEIFLEGLFSGMSIKEAGLAAGYSPIYVQKCLSGKFKNEAFKQKVRDYAFSHNAKSIPKVMDLYNKTVEALHGQVCNGNLDNLAKLKHIPRDILTIAKVLVPEQYGQVVNYVNIESLQAVINGKFVKQSNEGESQGE